MNGLGRCTTPIDLSIDLDYCTLVGARSLGLRLCWICTSEEDKWLVFWDSSSHQREKCRQQLQEAQSFGAHSPEHTLLCWPSFWASTEAGQKGHHVLPYLSLPAALAAVQMPTLYQVRPADASSMPQGLRQHASHVSSPPHPPSQALGLLFNGAQPIIMCLQGWLSAVAKQISLQEKRGGVDKAGRNGR